MEQTLANAIRLTRQGLDLSIRELARRAGVSAAQISRIESGEVNKPSVETLVALARALNSNPIPLLILAGHVREREARERLDHFLAIDSELAQDWQTFQRGDQFTESRRVVHDPDSSWDALAGVAFYVFMTAETEETLWHDAFLAVQAGGDETSDLQQVITLWPSVSRERRPKVLDFVRDQVAISRAEFAAEMRELDADDKSGGR